MRIYIDIRNDYEFKHAIQEIEKYEKLQRLLAPTKAEDEGRTTVHVKLRGVNDMIIDVEGRYDLIQKLLDKIHETRA